MLKAEGSGAVCADRNEVQMCSDSKKNMSAFADQNHAPSLTCVRLELIVYSE